MSTASEASQQANRSGLDPKRVTVIFYLVAGLVFALFLEHLFGLLWGKLSWDDREIFEGLGWRVSTLVGFGLAAATALTLYFHPRTHALSLEVASELMKVTWPSWGETRMSTFAVVVASVLAAVLLFFIDTLAYNLMVEWLPAVWGKLS